MSTAPAEGSKEPAATGATAPAAETAKPVAAAQAASAPSPSVDPAAFADMQKQLAKTSKALEASEKAREEQGGILGKLKAAFGGDDKKDPVAELNTLKQGFESTAAENRRLKAEYAVEKMARELNFLDADEQFGPAANANIIGADFSVDPDAVKNWLTKRAADRPHLVRAPVVVAAPVAGPPAAPGTKPPAAVQPAAGTPPPPPPPAGFDAWVTARTAH